MKDPVIILIYDPLNGNTVPDGRVKLAIKTLYDVVNRDKYLKTNFGSLNILKEFIHCSNDYGVNPEHIEVFQLVDGKKSELKISLWFFEIFVII